MYKDKQSKILCYSSSNTVEEKKPTPKQNQEPFLKSPFESTV